MFLLWIACIFQVIISLECDNSSMLEPKYKYKYSMQQVGTILADIDQRIKHERQILHQLAINPAISADNTTQWLANVSENLENLARNHYPRNRIHFRHGLEEVSLNQLIEDGQTTATRITPIFSESLRKQVGHVDNLFEQSKENLPPEDVSSLVDDWRRDLDVYVEEDTAQQMLNNKKIYGPKKIPLITKLNILMAEQGVGYSYAAVIGFSDVILEKDTDDLKTLIDLFSKSIVRLSNEGKLNSLGNLFANRMKLLRVWSLMSSVSSVKGIAQNARQALGDKNLDNDFVKILTTYDTFFTPDEGQYLLEKLAAIYEVNIKSGDHSILSFFMDDFIEAFIAPADRLHNSIQLKSLIDMINKLYLKGFPDLRRSQIDTLVNTINEYESTKTRTNEEARRLSRSNIESGWRKILRHLIVKHPKLLRKFIDHFKRLKKNHRASHHKNVNKKHKHNKKITAESKKSKADNEKNDHLSSPRLRVQNKATGTQKESRENYKMGPNVWFNTHSTGYPETIRRLMSTASTDYEKILTTTKELQENKSKKKNKLLQKILADSSYSDEETELKTMLSDALKTHLQRTSYNASEHKRNK